MTLFLSSFAHDFRVLNTSSVTPILARTGEATFLVKKGRIFEALLLMELCRAMVCGQHNKVDVPGSDAMSVSAKGDAPLTLKCCGDGAV